MRSERLTEYMPPHWRFERKFSGPGLSPDVAAVVIRQHPAGFVEAFPPRWINNIYFDTPSLKAYYDNTNGISHRVKTRVRWYGEGEGLVSAPLIERKIRRALESGKISHELPALTVDGKLTHATLARMFDSANLPDATREVLRHLRPVLLNRYYRRYYVSANRRFRITVDTQLHFRPANSFSGGWQSMHSGEAGVIIELKFDRAEAAAAPEITQALPFRLSRCSKYVMGVDLLRVT